MVYVSIFEPILGLLSIGLSILKSETFFVRALVSVFYGLV